MKFSKSTRSRFLRRNSVIGPSSLLDASWLGDRFYIVKELFSTYLALSRIVENNSADLLRIALTRVLGSSPKTSVIYYPFCQCT